MSRIVEWRTGTSQLGACVAAIGVFDGVHLGHQALISDTLTLAAGLGCTSAVVTFDRDPDQVVAPERAAVQLLTLRDKIDFISALGVDTVLVVPFDPSVASMLPDEFVTRVLLAAFEPKVVAVGHDFRFGRGATGDVRTLAAAGTKHGFDVRAHELVRTADGRTITSTRIRGLLKHGDVAGAAELLGRPHRLRGQVMPGRGVGSEIGFPTANLSAAPFSPVPSDGVYAARAHVGGAEYAAGVFIGAAPTFSDSAPAIEAHLLRFEGDLYGEGLLLEFAERVRDNEVFSSREDLARAIASDLERVKDLFGAF